MALTIADMKIGSRLMFGKYSILPDAEPSPISWLKASNNGDFIAEHCIEYCQYDAAENIEDGSPRTNTYYNGSTDWTTSNIRQFLNSVGENWYEPTHPFDAPPTRRGWGSSRSIANHPGFLDSFEPYELSAIIRDVDDYFRLPTKNEILFAGFPLFNKKGLRATLSADLRANCDYRWLDISDYNYMAYWTATASDARCMYVINRSARSEMVSPSAHCGVRPVCRIRSDAVVYENAYGVGYVLDESASCEAITSLTTRIFDFLGI